MDGPPLFDRDDERPLELPLFGARPEVDPPGLDAEGERPLDRPVADRPEVDLRPPGERPAGEAPRIFPFIGVPPLRRVFEPPDLEPLLPIPA